MHTRRLESSKVLVCTASSEKLDLDWDQICAILDKKRDEDDSGGSDDNENLENNSNDTSNDLDENDHESGHQGNEPGTDEHKSKFAGGKMPSTEGKRINYSFGSNSSE